MKTKEEIMKAMEICSDYKLAEKGTCLQCPYKEYEECCATMLQDALRLIKELDSQNKIPESWKESVMQSFSKVE